MLGSFDYDGPYVHVETVRHRGVLIAFALEASGRLVYSVLRPDRVTSDEQGWSKEPIQLQFPCEIDTIGFAASETTQVPLAQHVEGSHAEFEPVSQQATGDPDPALIDWFFSSTGRLTALTRFQVVSDDECIYLFRQSVAAGHPRMVTHPVPSAVPVVDSNLLVDRFVLVESSGDEDPLLIAKREVRFQRSRSRTRPAGPKDSLGTEDLDGNRFVEPTHIIGFVGKIDEGRFAALIVPTAAAQVNRWVLFAEDPSDHAIYSYSAQRSRDGLFDLAADDGAGIDRSWRFSVAGNHFATGMSALLYHQQEQTEAGYRGIRKPAKGSARVLLAVGTDPVRTAAGATAAASSPAPTDQTFPIAVLDLGVGADGLLAGLPTSLALPPVEMAGEPLVLGGTKIRTPEEALVLLTQRSAELTASNNVTAGGMSGAGRRVQLQTALAALATRSWPLEPVDPRDDDLVAGYRKAVSDVSRAKAQAHAADDAVVAFQRRTEEIAKEHEAADFRMARDQTNAHGGDYWKNWDQIRSDASAARLTEAAARASELSALQQTAAALWTRVREQEPDVAKKAGEATGLVANRIAWLDKQPAAPGTDGARLDPAQLKADIDTLQIYVDGDHPVAMALVTMDPAGRTASGGICSFAATTTRPVLFESAVGRVSMYFRGNDGVLLAAHYSSSVVRPAWDLPTKDKTPALRLQAISTERGRLAVTIAASSVSRRELPARRTIVDETTCDLIIDDTSSAAPIRETWHGLPRDPAAMAAVLAGSTAGQFELGPVTGTVGDRLTIKGGLRRAVGAGVPIEIGAGVRVSAKAAAIGATSVALRPGPAIDLGGADPAATPVMARAAFDFEHNTQSTATAGVGLSASMLVRAVVIDPTGSIVDGTAAASAGSSSSWTRVATGRALEFDAPGGAVSSNGDAYACRGDLTVEAWVKPSAALHDWLGRDPFHTLAPIVHQWSSADTRSSTSAVTHRYMLGLHRRDPLSDDLHLFGSVDGVTRRSEFPVPVELWSHVAMTYDRAFAVGFDKGAQVECASTPMLDLSDDLTVRATVVIRQVGAAMSILRRSADPGAPAAPAAWNLGVDASGHLLFEWTTESGQVRSAISDVILTTGAVHHVAVTRERIESDPKDVTKHQQRVALFVDGAVTRTEVPDVAAATSQCPITFGRGLVGSLSAVSVWTRALALAELNATAATGSKGSVSLWRMSEGEGRILEDAAGNSPARILRGATWIPDPDPTASKLTLLCDGVAVSTLPYETGPAGSLAPRFALGADASGRSAFLGQLEEVRVWRKVRTAEEIGDNRHRRLNDAERTDLVAYYSFSAARAAVTGRVGDERFDDEAFVLTYGNNARLTLSTVPISDDAPQVRNVLLQVKTDDQARISASPSVAEYSDTQVGSDGVTRAVLKRAHSTIAPDGRWVLWTGYKVGDLDMEWLGQAQFAPQLFGYIEGAPPVPAENFKEGQSYDGVATVTLTDADSATYTYSSSRGSGTDSAVSYFAGIKIKEDASLGVGVIKSLAWGESKIGVQGSHDASQENTDTAESTSTRSASRVSSMTLRGRLESAQERDPKRKTGTSGQPEDARYVPDNVGFALVKSETADVFALRLQHTRTMISYSMRPNPDIPPDWNIITFRIREDYTKQGTLDGRHGLEKTYQTGTGTSSGTSYLKPIEAYQLKARIDREAQQDRTLYEQFDARGAGRNPTAIAKGDVLGPLPKGLRRNLVNTYVWTAAGGHYSEEVQALDSISEVTGGSYSLAGQDGLHTDGAFGGSGMGFAFDLTALAGTHLNTSATKTRGSERSFGVSVAIDPESDLRPAGSAEATPGSVDAYRFMTFYLEPSTANFDHFFNQVIDPIWLDSADPGAVALRSARQPAKQPPCWRVMHRVTYVSRVREGFSGDPEVDAALAELDVSSNFELIRLLEPAIRQHGGSTSDAIRSAVQAHPELAEHEGLVIDFLTDYYRSMPGLLASTR